MNFLPSKNFIALIGGAAIIIFVGWFSVHVWDFRKVDKLAQQIEEKRNLTLAEAHKNAELDSDKDGLKDWEEKLWRTDPHNPDTDGDGTHDGREILEGRDPTVAGPDDKLKKPEEKVANNSTASLGPQTLTEKAADEFAGNYLGAKYLLGGNPLPQDLKSLLSDTLFFNLQKGNASFTDEFTMEDLRVFYHISGEEKGITKNYLNELGRALEENFKDIPEDSQEFINSLSLSTTEEQKIMLEKFLKAYTSTVDFLKIQEVPHKYAPLHLTLLNSMNMTVIAFNKIIGIEDDPLLALVGMQLYYKELVRSKEYLVALKKQVAADNLVFEPGEGGEFFNQYFAQL